MSKPITSPRAAVAAAVLALCAAGAASAQPADTLQSAVTRAVTGNPDVNARFNAWLASGDAIDIARSGWKPRVDADASLAQDRDRITSRNPQSGTLNRQAVGLTLTQLLWDGLATRDEVNRLDHERMARYFDLIETTEQTALEAGRAHHDVQRFRKLVALAEDNYVQLRYASLQIQQRVRAGVGRGVDLEQAGARVALAESNLATEVANLHDVTQRYLRLVGELPPARLDAPASFKTKLPASAGEAATSAVRDSAGVSAAVATLRAARAAVGVREAAWQPRVEARLRGQAGHNVNGVVDQKRDATAEIVLNWNLYNGGGDQARIRQQVRNADQAADLRDRVCRDTRQVAGIAFNDTRKYAELLQALDRNTLAIEKARNAYRQQFDIGQRSLLDLLNAENELYTARRALTNAEFDLAVSELRTLAATQRLTTQLGIARNPALGDAGQNWQAGEDGPSARCPVLVAETSATPLQRLDAQADQMLKDAPKAPAR